VRSFLSVNANRSSRQRSFSPSQHVTHYLLRVEKPRSFRKPRVEHGGGRRTPEDSRAMPPPVLVPLLTLGIAPVLAVLAVRVRRTGKGRPLPYMTRCSLTGFRTRDGFADAPACTSVGLVEAAGCAGLVQSTANAVSRGRFYANLTQPPPAPLMSTTAHGHHS
jgi:hypothetical protein